MRQACDVHWLRVCCVLSLHGRTQPPPDMLGDDVMDAARRENWRLLNRYADW